MIKKWFNFSKLVFVIDGEWEHLLDSSQTMSETRLDRLKDGAIKCIQKKFCVYTFFGMYNLTKET